MTSYLCKYSSSRHEDSAGHKGTIEAGGVQWMCAVRQIPISPLPFFLTKIENLSFFQGRGSMFFYLFPITRSTPNAYRSHPCRNASP